MKKNIFSLALMCTLLKREGRLLRSCCGPADAKHLWATSSGRELDSSSLCQLEAGGLLLAREREAGGLLLAREGKRQGGPWGDGGGSRSAKAGAAGIPPPGVQIQAVSLSPLPVEPEALAVGLVQCAVGECPQLPLLLHRQLLVLELERGEGRHNLQQQQQQQGRGGVGLGWQEREKRGGIEREREKRGRREGEEPPLALSTSSSILSLYPWKASCSPRPHSATALKVRPASWAW